MLAGPAAPRTVPGVGDAVGDAVAWAAALAGADPVAASAEPLTGGLVAGNTLVRVHWVGGPDVVVKSIADPRQWPAVEAAVLAALAGVPGVPRYLAHQELPGGSVRIAMTYVPAAAREWAEADRVRAHGVLVAVGERLQRTPVALPSLAERHPTARQVERGGPVIAAMLPDGAVLAARARAGLAYLHGPAATVGQHVDCWAANWVLVEDGPVLVDFGNACRAVPGYDHALLEVLTSGPAPARVERALAAGCPEGTLVAVATVQALVVHAGLDSSSPVYRAWCRQYRRRVVDLAQAVLERPAG